MRASHRLYVLVSFIYNLVLLMTPAPNENYIHTVGAPTIYIYTFARAPYTQMSAERESLHTNMI